jgi:ABC-type phosphate/phosphonate transport system substrate-binding protein
MKKTVYPNWSFFWNTRLSEDRMQEISDFLGTLSKQDKNKIEDLIQDSKEEADYDCNEFN